MNATKITIRPLRSMTPVLPAEVRYETVLLLRVDRDFRVVERMLFKAHAELGRISVPGFTHWARLPFFIWPKKPRKARAAKEGQP